MIKRLLLLLLFLHVLEHLLKPSRVTDECFNVFLFLQILWKFQRAFHTAKPSRWLISVEILYQGWTRFYLLKTIND